MDSRTIRAAIRKKWIKSACIQEVSIEDSWYYANYWRNQIDTYPWGQKNADKYGAHPSKTLDPEWSHRSPSYRIIDLLVIDKHRTAVEIKVSRSDFRRDTEAKRRPWFEVTHKFYYAAPLGLLSPDEMPEHCGLLEFDESLVGSAPWQHGIVVTKRAKIRQPLDLPGSVTAGLIRRLSSMEYRVDTDATAK